MINIENQLWDQDIPLVFIYLVQNLTEIRYENHF